MTVRQMTEWDLCTLQKNWKRIKDRFIYEERVEISVMLQLVTSLHNVRAKIVVINQIKYIFMPSLMKKPNDLLM